MCALEVADTFISSLTLPVKKGAAAAATTSCDPEQYSVRRTTGGGRTKSYDNHTDVYDAEAKK